jgi:hypothetical protein
MLHFVATSTIIMATSSTLAENEGNLEFKHLSANVAL